MVIGYLNTAVPSLVLSLYRYTLLTYGDEVRLAAGAVFGRQEEPLDGVIDVARRGSVAAARFDDRAVPMPGGDRKSATRRAAAAGERRATEADEYHGGDEEVHRGEGGRGRGIGRRRGAGQPN